jgi:hypothetical protein
MKIIRGSREIASDLAILGAPRARLERATYCLGGTTAQRCADLRNRTSPASETAKGSCCLNDLALASRPALGASQRQRELGQQEDKRCDQKDNRRPLAADLNSHQPGMRLVPADQSGANTTTRLRRPPSVIIGTCYATHDRTDDTEDAPQGRKERREIVHSSPDSPDRDIGWKPSL